MRLRKVGLWRTRRNDEASIGLRLFETIMQPNKLLVQAGHRSIALSILGQRCLGLDGKLDHILLIQRIGNRHLERVVRRQIHHTTTVFAVSRLIHHRHLALIGRLVINKMSDTRLVKLYHCVGDAWNDCGTGYVTIQYRTEGSGANLEVRSESDASVMLQSDISTARNYSRQGSTMLLWQEADGRDLALSYQCSAGLEEIVQQIKQIRKFTEDDFIRSMDPDEAGERTESVSTEPQMAVDKDKDLPSMELQPLPTPEIPRLEEIDAYFENISKLRHEALTKVNRPFRERFANLCEDLATQIMERGYVSKLLDAFRMCEDLEDTASLNFLFRIFRSLLSLGTSSILEQLFDMDVILDVIATQEYEPERPTKHNYKAFLTGEAVFKEIVPFSDRTIVPLIHQTFYIHYIKEMVLTNVVDDFLMGTIASFINIKQGEIVEKIKSDQAFLVALITKVANPAEKGEIRLDCMKCLLELSRMGATVGMELKSGLHETLCKFDVFRIAEPCLSSADAELRTATLSVLTVLLETEPSMRVTLAHNSAVHTIIGALARRFVSEPILALVKIHLTVLQYLLDTNILEIVKFPPHLKSGLLQRFYDGHLGHMLEVFDLPDPAALTSIRRQRIENMLEFLGFCVQTHSFTARSYITQHSVLRKVAMLFHLNSNTVSLGVLKLFRALLATEDDFYIRNMVKFDVCKPIMACLERNGPRYNLLDSAVLELFELIRLKNMKPLLQYLAESYGHILRTLTYVRTFELLLLRNEQNKEVVNGSSESKPVVDLRFKRDTSMSVEEEDYFNSDDKDEEPSPTGAAASLLPVPAGVTTPQFRPRRQLVDYDDDDDDDFLTKRKKSG
eukprot:m.17092 g.17092  ORF g.17092 m.17092 type:complete len:846 (+) comp7044_c0_seq1:1089-3626(+)